MSVRIAPRAVAGTLTVCCLASVSLISSTLLAADEQAGIDFFEQRIRPLLIEHCYECHAAEEQSGNLRLDSRSAWQAGGESGAVIISGEPALSRLIEAVRYENLALQMPPSGKLSSEQIAALEHWIHIGAPDPRDAQITPVDGPSQNSPSKHKALSIEEGHDFWSLRPLSNPETPAVVDQAWGTTPIDAFILSQLEAHDLHPAPAADKRTLLRRATLDLIGLPPSPAEVEAFVIDSSPTAFQTVVERLLASPQYGERWGRHWLDVARYADSNGLDENLAYGNAWRYRDYVIASFNSDKPFDRFLIEQLAGDLLPEANVETLAATGFLSLGAKVLAEPDVEKLIMDTVDEQIDATGKAFLGMTLGCARCHDHKFDPILQSDYYALAGFFKSTRTFDGTNNGAIKHWHEHKLASAEELAQLQSIDAEIAKSRKAATDYKREATEQIRVTARGAAAKYFAAASLCGSHPSLNDVREIAEQAGLHPRMLYHFHGQLQLRQSEPLLATWHQQVARGASSAEIEGYYEKLLGWLVRVDVQDDNGNRRDGSTKTNSSGRASGNYEERPPHPILTRARKLDRLLPELLVVPVQPEFAFERDTLDAYYALLEAARVVESNAPDPASIMGVRDGPVLVSVPLHIRGSHRNLGEPIPRAFPTVMRTSSVPPVLPRRESGRLELAQWMASSQHPLTARVYVNRIWRWHFGRGLVSSTENFGLLGDPPSHPELLDRLARTFIESGWSTKELHRLLLSSSLYQMSTTHPNQDQAEAVDPENRWMWKFNRSRLEAEQLRDALLTVSDRLDSSMGGKTVPLRNRQFVFDHTSRDFTTYDSLRRAVYLPVIRNNVYTLFEQFDFPDATMPTGSRQQTVVAPQSLLMLNDELVMDSANALAAKVCHDFSQAQQRVDWAYQLALSRPADARERQRAIDFVARMLNEQDSVSIANAIQQSPTVNLSPEELRAWSLFCHALLASNEFITVE